MVDCPISVIIPTYNRDKFLKRAIDSVCRQTWSCSEIIVVDDGSTDNTEKLLFHLAQESKIPLVVIRSKNQGVAAARNLGIKKAKYDYLAFLDSDDHWGRKKIEIQFQKFKEQNKFQISHTKERWFRRGVHLNQKRKHIPRHGDIFCHCLELCAVGASTVMLRKELLEQVGVFDEKMNCCEDYDLWLRVSASHEFLLIDAPLTIKEGGRKDQLSHIHRIGMDERRIYSIKKLLDTGELSPGRYKKAMAEFERKINVFAKGCLKHNRQELGYKYLKLLQEYKQQSCNFRDEKSPFTIKNDTNDCIKLARPFDSH
ncbi:glycosyltransferase family A protein [Desulforhopalus sp. IMCC35007]|uniref:glycosyltransferase family 2 protein n=1 Tax=Desulforhopalus sp. IMCC35007 TaxID=2569543 RepID=UPI0010AEE4EA|nr:glycosyltransferase family A protein [Desulforhopalus sp. IMCC35007]TKB11173.1 glycosyltransferase family 2 protein [Desulforhopalus sp. IMCC35007]